MDGSKIRFKDCTQQLTIKHELLKFLKCQKAKKLRKTRREQMTMSFKCFNAEHEIP